MTKTPRKPPKQLRMANGSSIEVRAAKDEEKIIGFSENMYFDGGAVAEYHKRDVGDNSEEAPCGDHWTKCYGCAEYKRNIKRVDIIS